MSKTVLDFLQPSELESLENFKKARLESRRNAVFYGAQIKAIMDRARARKNREEKSDV